MYKINELQGYIVHNREHSPYGIIQYSPWGSPDQNTGVGSPSLLQGIFPNRGLNPGLPHCRQILYQLSHQGSPKWSISYNNFESLCWTTETNTILLISYTSIKRKHFKSWDWINSPKEWLYMGRELQGSSPHVLQNLEVTNLGKLQWLRKCCKKGKKN